MATITSVGSGNWATAGTWDTGVPADGDDVVIASGHTVTFNADQSAFTTGVKITITGTLNHATTGGPYTMFIKTGASVVGAGTWNIGTSGAGAIPFAVKHTITGAAGWYVDGISGLKMTVYGAEPSIKTIKLSGDEAIGQTELSVDTNVTGDIWADGDIIRIDDINKAAESEERVIAAGGRAAGAITVTAGLTAAKSTGAVVSLITRNIKIIQVGTPGQTLYRLSDAGDLAIGGGMWYGANRSGFATCHNATITGGTFSGFNTLLNICSATPISGGVFSANSTVSYNSNNVTISGGSFSGNANILGYCSGAIISDGVFSGNSKITDNCYYPSVYGVTFIGNGNCLSNTYSPLVFGITATGNTAVFNNCTGIVGSSITASANTNDIYASLGNLYNCIFGSTTEYARYDLSNTGNENCQSEDNYGSDGALKAWCRGGVVTSQTTVKPTGYTQAYLLNPESATYPVFFKKSFSVEPGKTVSIEVQLRKDASMTYLPRVYLMASIGNPLAGTTPVDSFTMTDSTDTWETDTFTIANSTNYDQDYTLWFVGKNASGNVYSAYDITTAGSTGGGSVKILPYSGKVGL